MKFIILAVLFALATAAPQRIFPRLPNAILKSKYQLILEDKIIGGKEVEPNSLPFQITLNRKSATGSASHSCGGSILDANVILIAAHCLRGVDPATVRVVAGEHNLNVDSGLEQDRNIFKVITHENYKPLTLENDICLLILELPLDLSVPSAQPINLPPPPNELELPVGTLLTVAGWGDTSYGGNVSEVLLSVDLPVVDDETCMLAYVGTVVQVFPSSICAGYIDGGFDSCNGDSGGPLFIGTGTEAVIHGIVSTGKECALPDYPGVYTQVSYFLDWIAANRE